MIMLQKLELIFILQQDKIMSKHKVQINILMMRLLFWLTKILIIFSPVYLPQWEQHTNPMKTPEIPISQRGKLIKHKIFTLLFLRQFKLCAVVQLQCSLRAFFTIFSLPLPCVSAQKIPLLKLMTAYSKTKDGLTMTIPNVFKYPC